MSMEHFTPFSALLGGALIGTSASLMLLLNGRITGISGILGGLLQRPDAQGLSERLTFLGGLLVGGLALALLAPSVFAMDLERSTGALVAAGLLVGFGTRLGSGCTSGHGVCGISRLSPRSLLATATFMATGFLAAAVVTHLFDGRL